MNMRNYSTLDTN